MTIDDYALLIRRSWWIVVLVGAIGALVGLGISLAQTPAYQARAQLFLRATELGKKFDPYSGSSYVLARIPSYLDVVDSPEVLSPAAGIDDPIAEAKLVAATNPPGTVLLNVTATKRSPEAAATTANAVAKSYAEKIERLEAGKVRVELVLPAIAPESPVSPQTLSNLGLGLLLGLTSGIGLALLRNRGRADAAEVGAGT